MLLHRLLNVSVTPPRTPGRRLFLLRIATQCVPPPPIPALYGHESDPPYFAYPYACEVVKWDTRSTRRQRRCWVVTSPSQPAMFTVSVPSLLRSLPWPPLPPMTLAASWSMRAPPSYSETLKIVHTYDISRSR